MLLQVARRSSVRCREVRREEVLEDGPGLVGGGVGELVHPGDVAVRRGGSFQEGRKAGVANQLLALRGHILGKNKSLSAITCTFISVWTREGWSGPV